MCIPVQSSDTAAFLRSVRESIPRPRAILVVSAHWEERRFTVMTSPRPPMLYDYGGFPREAYALKYPAPGSPELAAQVRPPQLSCVSVCM